MKYLLITVSAVILLTFSIAACSPADEKSDSDHNIASTVAQAEQDLSESPSEPEQNDQTEYLAEIPAKYYEESVQPGQVIQVNYESQDYTRSNGSITKPAWVYLPYGYDENDTDTRYDILYLMHGWTMTASDFLDEGKSDLVNLLDNMIEAGNIPPMIVVSATFDAENQSQNFSRSVEELSVFHNDLRDHLMPYIESRFHTYAEETSPEGFRDSRAHRAFGGFSLGAVTTWYQFIYNLDYIKYFVPMSGDCWIMGTYGGRYYPVETVDFLEDVIAEGGYGKEDFRIYQGIGTDDPIWDQTDSQIQEMFRRSTFTPENLHYAIIEGGRHDMDACERYLYYALQDFFSGEE